MTGAAAASVAGPVGFVGAGTIGGPIAARLLAAGHALVVHDLRADALDGLVAAGASRAASPREVAERCAVVFTSLPGPAEVSAVATGEHGLLAAGRAGLAHVDLSTSSVDAVRRLHAAEAEAGAVLLDAPVSGGAHGARQGTLAVMASGDRAAFDAVRPLFDAFAANVFHLGEPGRGTAAKLVNNLIFLSGALLVQEAFVLAAKAGIGAHEMLEIVNASSAKLYAGMAPLLLGRNFGIEIFKLDIAAKDVALAVESARGLGAPLALAEAAAATYRRAVEEGHGNEVFFAALQTLERAAGTEVEKVG